MNCFGQSKTHCDKTEPEPDERTDLCETLENPGHSRADPEEERSRDLFLLFKGL